MIKLNNKFSTDTIINIPKNLSRQVREAKICGDYKVTGYYNNYILLSKTDGSEVLTDTDTLSYLSGCKVNNPELWEVIDAERYQPELTDFYNYNYFVENERGMGYWYCGYVGPRRCITVSLVNSRWCYSKMPWD